MSSERLRFGDQHRDAMVAWVVSHKKELYNHGGTKGVSYNNSFKSMLKDLQDLFPSDDWRSVNPSKLKKRWENLVKAYKRSIKPSTGHGVRNNPVGDESAGESDDEPDSVTAGKEFKYSEELFELFMRTPDFHPPSTRNAGGRALALERMAAAKTKATTNMPRSSVNE